MLRLLDVYTVFATFSDHPVYNGQRYRQGSMIRVEAGTKVRPLEILQRSDHEPDSLYMGQIVNEDGSSGGKVRIYEGDLEETRHVTSSGTITQSTGWEINPFLAEFVQVVQPVLTEAYGYINTADSILREDNE